MTEIFLPLASITLLFFVLLGVKELLKGKLKENFCVICTAAFLTWIALILLYKLHLFNNQLIIALLIGESTVGIYYLVDKKIPRLKVFRLPLLLTLIFVGYSLLAIPTDLLKVVILLLAVWTVFGFVFISKSNKNIKQIVEKIIECCKNW